MNKEFSECNESFKAILGDEKLKNVPVLAFGNKADLIIV